KGSPGANCTATGEESTRQGGQNDLRGAPQPDKGRLAHMLITIKSEFRELGRELIRDQTARRLEQDAHPHFGARIARKLSPHALPSPWRRTRRSDRSLDPVRL